MALFMHKQCIVNGGVLHMLQLNLLENLYLIITLFIFPFTILCCFAEFTDISFYCLT